MNVDHYTDAELLSVLGVDNTASPQVIGERCTELAQKYGENFSFSQFFEQVKERLLNADTPAVFSSDVKRGNLNPDVKNTVTRMLNIDTYYRDTLEVNNSRTDDCAFQLTEELRDVISLTLYSVEIPQTWYNFSEAKGNTAFLMSFNMVDSSYNTTSVLQTVVSVPDGNYNNVQLIGLLNVSITNVILAQGYPGISVVMTQDPTNGLVSMTLTQDLTPDSTGNVRTYTISLRFFDPNFSVPALRFSSINNNLGWNLGFRSETAYIHEGEVSATNTMTSTVTAPCVMSTALTKYVMMRVDDFKQNRLNRGIVNVRQTKEAHTTLPALAGLENSYFDTRKASLETAPTLPRRLTNKQLYGIKAVNEKNIAMATRTRAVEPNDADIFAKIPLRDVMNTWSTWNPETNTSTVVQDGPARLFVEFSGPLQLNVREYFGPVNISALRVTLYDDHGNILGLNGHDWSCTILVKSLYQY